MNIDIIILITIFILLIVLNKNYKVDNKQPNSDKAYEYLITIRNNYKKILKEQCKDEYKQYISNIQKKIENIEIKENNNKKNGTSYNINKGEVIYICLRNTMNNLHDFNKVMYVAIHELAHIGCPEIGHTDLFFDINRELLRMAIKAGVYRYENYNGEEYCGISLSVNVLNN